MRPYTAVALLKIETELEIREQGKSGLVPGGKTSPFDQFAFQAGEEAFAQGVVVAVADRTHGRSDLGLSASFAEGHRGVLRSLVAVVDHAIGSTLAKGHVQGVFDQFASQMVGHGPADDAAN